jgi:hypothetical protein
MGLERTTSSLGIFTSIEYKGTRRSPACMQIQATQQLLSHLPLIGGFLEGAPSSPFSHQGAERSLLPHRLRDREKVELNSRQFQVPRFATSTSG